MKKIAKILSVVLCLAMVLSFASVAIAAENNTISVVIADYADANGWTNGTQYPTVNLDSVVSVTASGTGVGSYGSNTGKYYEKGENWRIYQAETPSIVVSAGEQKIISVKISYDSQNDGVLTLDGANVASDEVVTVNASSVTFSVGNTGEKTNGQARITAIEVVYDGEAGTAPTPTPTPEPEPEPDPVEALQFVAEPVDGVAYKFGMTQVKTNQNLYLTGEMNGYYFATTEDIEQAADVYVENVEGGFKLYLFINEVKTYIDIVVSGRYNNVVFSTEGAKVFAYNAELNCLITNVEGNDLYLGTYNENVTIGASKTSYINAENTGVSQFPAGLVAIAEEEPPVEPAPSKTLTIGDKSFTAEGGKWLYNGEVDATTAANYTMIIFDKNYAGEVAINGYGAALVLNKYGNIVKFYDGANVAFYTEPGAKGAAHFTSGNYATVAFNELAEGEILVIFPNDGAGNAARGWALGLRGLDGKDYFNQAATLEGFTFETAPVEPDPSVPETQPSEPETQPTEPSVPETEATQPTETIKPSTPGTNPGTGDSSPIMLAAAMMMAAAALIVLVQKKRAV